MGEITHQNVDVVGPIPDQLLHKGIEGTSVS